MRIELDASPGCVIVLETDGVCLAGITLDLAVAVYYTSYVSQDPESNLGTPRSWWREWGLVLSQIPQVTNFQWNPEVGKVPSEILAQLVGQTIGKGMVVTYENRRCFVTGLITNDLLAPDGEAMTLKVASDITSLTLTPCQFIDLDWEY